MKWSWGWVLNWTFIFLFNLPNPLMLGLDVTIESGRLGMFIAIPVLWFLGIPLVLFPGRFRLNVCVGGVAQVFCFFFPIFPAITGSFSLITLGFVTGDDYFKTKIDSFPLGFTATVLTGQGIALICVILGYPLSHYLKVREPFGFNKLFRSGSKQADEPAAGDTLPE